MDTVTLREYFEALLAEKQKALDLQAREYERRLGELNHAHDRIKEVLATTVSREFFDAYEANHAEWGQSQVDSNNTKFGAINKQMALITGGLSVVIFLANVIPPILSLLR